MAAPGGAAAAKGKLSGGGPGAAMLAAGDRLPKRTLERRFAELCQQLGAHADNAAEFFVTQVESQDVAWRRASAAQLSFPKQACSYPLYVRQPAAASTSCAA